MSGESGTVELLLREIPEAYRGPGFAVVRNNILDATAGAMRQASQRATTYAMNRWSLTTVLECEVEGLDVAYLLANTVAWSTGAPVEEVSAEHLRRVVRESAGAREAARAALREGVLAAPIVDATGPELLGLVEAQKPRGFVSTLSGRASQAGQAAALGLLTKELEHVRTLRSTLTESVAAFGEASSPASAIAGFAAYLQCGQRLEASLMGVRIGGALGWSDERVKLLTQGADPVAALRPSFQVELLRVAA